MQLSRPIYQLKRSAKLLAREAAIPLHEAQARIARSEGFATWSLLSAKASSTHVDAPRPHPILPDLAEGEMMLLAARPGQGKTLTGLQLLVDAVNAGRRAVFFTLDMTESQTHALLERIGAGDAVPEIVMADDIEAASIQRHLADAPAGTVAVIDYLQILDQRRDTPPLAEQLAALQSFARTSGVSFAFIAQIDRAYDPDTGALPGSGDLRLPNPVPLDLFASACFAHAGRSALEALG
ncbi:DNA helicase [Alteriqipengyuania sp. 357]